jgi:hypothetical protein
MATLGTYYLNGPSLTAATAAYTDSDLKNVAPDGFYSDGVTIREMAGGAFTDVISSCAPCEANCSSTPINVTNGKSFLEMNQQVGGTSFDIGAIVVNITFIGNAAPLGFYIEYDGVQYNTVSSAAFGLLQGPVGANQVIYIGDVAHDCGITAAFQPLPKYEYNAVTNTFDNTGATVSVIAYGPQLQLTTGSPLKCVMVIPKLSPLPSSIYFQGRLLCSPNNFNITINCPTKLASFSSTTVFPTGIETCMAVAEQTYYVADVRGTVNASPSGKLGLYDLVYSDFNGQYPLENGFYRSPRVPPTAPPPFGTPQNWLEVQDGVIVSFGTCPSVIEWNIDYQVQNAIAGACSANVPNLRIQISQPPTTYVNQNAPHVGTAHIAAGTTHVQLRMYWFEVYTPCNQVKMVIEKDGVVIAYKILTPTSGIYEYLDVDFNLDADCNIYGYVTLI